MHTKGPLTAEYSNVYRVIKNKDGDTDIWIMVADCLSGTHISYKEAKANARLFAEAPAMLKELEKVIDHLVTNNPMGLMMREMGNEINAIIRNAKGE
jgi:hypothetical protein